MTLTPRRLLALAALVPALVLAACGTTPAAQVPTEVPAPTAGPTETAMSVPQEPTPVLEPYANFPRQQYEDAIAKWRTAGVQRYRIKSSFSAFSLLGGTWTLTVDSSAGPPNVVEYSSEAGGRSADTAAGAGDQGDPSAGLHPRDLATRSRRRST